MQEAKLNRQRIDSLTGARFVAIMIIVFSHFEFLRQYGQFGEIYWHYFHNATMGVDFFFMLSGFGMMLSSIRQDPFGTSPIGGIYGLINFGKKHIRKIYSVYVVFLLTGIPYTLIVGHFEDGQSLGRLIAKIAVFFSVDLTLLQSGTGYTRFSHSLNGVCWFLSTLFCIYLISPIIMKTLKQRVKTVKSAFISLMITVFISYILSILFSWIDNHTFFDDLCYGSPYRRVFYVISGMLIAQIYNTFKSNQSIRFPAFISTGVFEYIFIGLSILWFFLRYSCQNALGHFVYVVDMLVVSGALLALAVSSGKISKVLSSKRFVFLGEISMYIFLSHYNIRMYTDLIVKTFHLESITAVLIEVAVILILTMIVSITIHHFRGQTPE